MQYTEYDDGFEFTRSSYLNVAAILLIEILLFIGGIYSFFAIEAPYNYVVSAPISLFFLLIGLSVAPAITASKTQKNILVWGADKNGLIVPAKRSSYTEYHAPDVVPWEAIHSAIYAQNLIDRTVRFDVSTSINVLVVELKNGKKQLFSYPEDLECVLFDFFSLAEHCGNRTYRAEALEIV